MWTTLHIAKAKSGHLDVVQSLSLCSCSPHYNQHSTSTCERQQIYLVLSTGTVQFHNRNIARGRGREPIKDGAPDLFIFLRPRTESYIFRIARARTVL